MLEDPIWIMEFDVYLVFVLCVYMCLCLCVDLDIIGLCELFFLPLLAIVFDFEIKWDKTKRIGHAQIFTFSL